MKKRIIVTGLIAAAVHLVLALGSVVIAYAAGMAAFDDPQYEPTSFEKAATTVWRTLMQPAMLIRHRWFGPNMPNAVEWLLLFGNSLLWGFTVALLVNAPALVRGKGR